MLLRSMLCLALAAGCVSGESAGSLTSVRRIFVDRLTGESSMQIRDMIINALVNTKLFVITENPDRSDATLRGSAEDLIYTDTFQASEGINARAGVGTARSTRLPSANVGVGQNESIRIAERKHEAMAAVRLVNRDGDVIWSTTQESNGAKFRSASADVADRVVKQLLSDIDRTRNGSKNPNKE